MDHQQSEAIAEDEAAIALSTEEASFAVLDRAIDFKLRGCYSEGLTSDQKRSVRRKAKTISVEHGEVFIFIKTKKVKYLTEKTHKDRALQSCHSHPTSGHFGITKTWHRLAERFYWKGLCKDVKNMVMFCRVCQVNNRKLDQKRPELHPIPVKSPWYHLGMDFVGPISPTSGNGNRYILTISDYFTRFGWAKALPTKEAKNVIQCLRELFFVMGLPAVITTDQGTEFHNEINRLLMNSFQIDHRLTTAYHPQANGLDERFNQTLSNAIAKFSQNERSNWDERIPELVYAYNTSQQASTKHPPFTVLFHRTARLPIDMLEDKYADPAERLAHYLDHAVDKDEEVEAKEVSDLLQNVKKNIELAQSKQKQNYDSKHGAGRSFQLNALVLKKDFRRSKRRGGKLDPKWLGPYRISGIVGKGLFSLCHCKDGHVVKRVNGIFKILKIFYENPADQTEPTSHDQTEPTSHDQTEPTSHDQTEPTSHDQTEQTSINHSEQTSNDQTESQNRSKCVANSLKNRMFQRRQAKVKDTANPNVVDVETYVPKKTRQVKDWLPDLMLTDADRQVLLHPLGWLTDNIINAAQKLLKVASPHISGLQDVTCGIVLSFDVEPGEFVQILNNRRGHWLTVSTIGCPHPTVSVYDSMYRSAGTHVKTQIASLLRTEQPTINLNFMDCQIQSGGCDCGLFAISNAMTLILGEDPNKLFIDQMTMRRHLYKCLNDGRMLQFPVKRRRRALKSVATVEPFDVHCTCRMPEMFEGEKWAECTKCLRWYHTESCLTVTSQLLEGDWLCPDCTKL